MKWSGIISARKMRPVALYTSRQHIVRDMPYIVGLWPHCAPIHKYHTTPPLTPPPPPHHHPHPPPTPTPTPPPHHHHHPTTTTTPTPHPTPHTHTYTHTHHTFHTPHTTTNTPPNHTKIYIYSRSCIILFYFDILNESAQILLGYFTGSGQSYECPNTTEATLKNMCK